MYAVFLKAFRICSAFGYIFFQFLSAWRCFDEILAYQYAAFQ